MVNPIIPFSPADSGESSKSPEQSQKIVNILIEPALAATRWLGQGIIHFPKAKDDPHHRGFNDKISEFFNENPELNGSSISGLIDLIEKSPMHKDLEPEQKEIFQSRFKKVKDQIIKDEEERKKELALQASQLSESSEEIAKKDIDGKNAMWKWRLLQVALLSCGICGVDILEPLFNVIDSMFFDANVDTVGEGIYEGLSEELPGAGHIGGGIGQIVADYTPVVGDMNTMLHAVGNSDAGNLFSSIAGPLAQNQLFEVGVAAAFLGNGIVGSELPHREDIQNRRQDLKIRLDAVQESALKELDNSAKSALNLAAGCFLEFKKNDIALNHVASTFIDRVDNKSLEQDDLLHIFQGMNFAYEGKTAKIENLAPEKLQEILQSIEEDPAKILKVLPKDQDNLNKIAERFAILDCLKSSPDYESADGQAKKDIFAATLKDLKDESKSGNPEQKIFKQRIESDKKSINQKICESLQEECKIEQVTIDNWRNSEKDPALKDKYVMDRLENQYLKRVTSDLKINKVPSSITHPEFSQKLSERLLTQDSSNGR